MANAVCRAKPSGPCGIAITALECTATGPSRVSTVIMSSPAGDGTLGAPDALSAIDRPCAGVITTVPSFRTAEAGGCAAPCRGSQVIHQAKLAQPRQHHVGRLELGLEIGRAQA